MAKKKPLKKKREKPLRVDMNFDEAMKRISNVKKENIDRSQKRKK